MEFIKQDGNVLIEEPCKLCGTVYANMKEGKGPHVAELRCSGCNHHVKWMSKGEYDLYLCYLTESPIDALVEKITNAQADYREADIRGDWIERKVAQKRLNLLQEYFTKMDGNASFTGYGS